MGSEIHLDHEAEVMVGDTGDDLFVCALVLVEASIKRGRRFTHLYDDIHRVASTNT